MLKNLIKRDKNMSRLVDLQLEASRLPDLSHIEKTKFDHLLAIDQLYYSSKLEGSHLTKSGLEQAIHGKNI
ncbi:MAG: hypothetical protein AAB493_00645 [Patescibacteria group bacterium]